MLSHGAQLGRVPNVIPVTSAPLNTTVWLAVVKANPGLVGVITWVPSGTFVKLKLPEESDTVVSVDPPERITFAPAPPGPVIVPEILWGGEDAKTTSTQ